MKKEIELLVRALIKNRNKVLLCKNLEKGHYFLPGGHIEFDENVQDALKREFYEETGLSLKISKFLGILENFFLEEEKIVHEINFIFDCKINKNTIKSKENYIAFFWVDLKDLNKIKLLPNQIKRFIKTKEPLFLIEKNV